MEIELNFERNEIYECGATLLSVLACPKASDEDKWPELHASLCRKALLIKYMLAQDDWTPVPVKLRYVFRDAKRVDRDFQFVGRRISDRMIAGRMAVPFIWRAELGDAFLLPRGIERLSVNQMSQYVLNDAGQADPENVESVAVRRTGVAPERKRRRRNDFIVLRLSGIGRRDRRHRRGGAQADR